MMNTTPAATQLTGKAARRILDLRKREGKPGLALRLAVDSGGCSGFRYNFSLDENPAEGDMKIEKDGALLVIDNISQAFLGGAVIDYVSELSGEGFQVQNPNTDAACGCGASFSPKNQ